MSKIIVGYQLAASKGALWDSKVFGKLGGWWPENFSFQTKQLIPVTTTNSEHFFFLSKGRFSVDVKIHAGHVVWVDWTTLASATCLAGKLTSSQLFHSGIATLAIFYTQWKSVLKCRKAVVVRGLMSLDIVLLRAYHEQCRAVPQGELRIMTVCDMAMLRDV